jgi:hypothetical protein
MKPSEVVERINRDRTIKIKVKLRNVQLWAANNEVGYTGEGRRKNYDFTETDFERFKNRKTVPGPVKEE